MKERLKYVDAAKGLSIIMIMLGHITGYSNSLDNWMSSFKVAIFYIISGFLMSYTGSVMNRKFKDFSGHLLKNLMLPYLSFSILAIIADIGILRVKSISFDESAEVVRGLVCDTVFLRGIHALWFLPTIFIGEIIFFILLHSHIAFRMVYAVAGLFSITAFNKLLDLVENNFKESSFAYVSLSRLCCAFGKSFMAAWFLLLGFYAFKLYAKLTDNRIKLALGIVMTVVNIYLSQLNEHVDINMMKEGIHPTLFYVGAILGSFGAIMILDFISSYKDLSGLNYWGKNSLIVLCTHTALGFKAVIFLGVRKYAFIPRHMCPTYMFMCFVVLILLMFLTCGVIEFVNNYCPFLIGKPYKNSNNK
ncbi:MAG: acyltransferase family protein [Lachnospiraceae bacterium]|nr:acyltransferase family protein [Lachnospiraceae bacterium]